MKYGQNSKNVRNELIQVLWSMFISLKVIIVVQRKRNKRDEKNVNKKENKFMTQLLKTCVSLPISIASLVPFFI